MVEQLSTNQDMEKIEAQLIAMKSYIKCEISNIGQKIKSLCECFNGVKETEKSNEVLQKNVTFLQNELIRKDEIIKSLLETQPSILETVSKPSVEEEKEEEEVSPTRNEIIEEIQWQKQSSGKKNKNEPKNIYIGNLSLDTKIDDLYELFGLRSTKYLRETCKINMPVNESKEKCKGFAFALVPEHVQK